MARLQRGAAWLVFVGLLGCSQIIDFDRGKILGGDAEVDGSVEEDGGGRPDGSRPDGGPDGAADTGVPDDSGLDPDSATPVACSRDNECQSNQLCCDGFCKDSSPGTGCATCGGESCGAAANTCSQRACSCGGGTPCEGAESFCEQVPGGGVDDYRCVQCREDLDCPTGNVCVDSACRPCDSSKGNTGCTNPTPICERGQNNCVACGPSNPCPAPLSCVGGACFGCVDGSNDGCDAASTAPVCDPISAAGEPLRLQCEGCVGDSECTNNPSGARCIATGACKACDPEETTSAGNPACTDPRNGYCNRSTYTCGPCGAEDCTGATNKCASAVASEDVPDALRGRCVQCDSPTSCPLSTRTPQCNLNTGLCTGCSGSTGGALCFALGRQVCSSSGSNSGACVECNINSDCSGTTPICQANQCVSCTVGGGNPACAMRNANTPACATDGRCAFCNAANFGCNTGTGSRANPYCNATSTACVACTAPAQCMTPDACSMLPATCTSANACQYTARPLDDMNACTANTCTGGVLNPSICTVASGRPYCISPAFGCGECRDGLDCVATPLTPVCNPGTHVCEALPAVPDAGMGI